MVDSGGDEIWHKLIDGCGCHCNRAHRERERLLGKTKTVSRGEDTYTENPGVVDPLVTDKFDCRVLVEEKLDNRPFLNFFSHVDEASKDSIRKDDGTSFTRGCNVFVATYSFPFKSCSTPGRFETFVFRRIDCCHECVPRT